MKKEVIKREFVESWYDQSGIKRSRKKRSTLTLLWGDNVCNCEVSETVVFGK